MSVDELIADNGVSTEVMTFRPLKEIRRSLFRFPHTIQEHFQESNMINTSQIRKKYNFKFKAVLNRIRIDFKYYQRLTIINLGTLSVKTRRELRSYNKGTSLWRQSYCG